MGELEGWVRNFQRGKDHYFIGGKTLCGVWNIAGDILKDTDYDPQLRLSKDNCRRCLRYFYVLRAKREDAEGEL